MTKKIILFSYYMLIIFLSLNNYKFSSQFKIFLSYDKFIHFIQYFILAIMISNIFTIKYKTLIISLLLIILSSLTIEFIQGYLTNRHSDSIDSLYDISGGIIGFYIYSRFKNAKKDNK